MIIQKNLMGYACPMD